MCQLRLGADGAVELAAVGSPVSQRLLPSGVEDEEFGTEGRRLLNRPFGVGCVHLLAGAKGSVCVADQWHNFAAGGFRFDVRADVAVYFPEHFSETVLRKTEGEDRRFEHGTGAQIPLKVEIVDSAGNDTVDVVVSLHDNFPVAAPLERTEEEVAALLRGGTVVHREKRHGERAGETGPALQNQLPRLEDGVGDLPLRRPVPMEVSNPAGGIAPGEGKRGGECLLQCDRRSAAVADDCPTIQQRRICVDGVDEGDKKLMKFVDQKKFQCLGVSFAPQLEGIEFESGSPGAGGMERQQAAFRIESRMKCRILLKGVQSPALPDVGNVLHLVRGGQLVRGIQMFPEVEVNRQSGCRRDSQTVGAVHRLK